MMQIIDTLFKFDVYVLVGVCAFIYSQIYSEHWARKKQVEKIVEGKVGIMGGCWILYLFNSEFLFL